jgi:tetratricopeptide (TPR) repeat protein
MILPLPALESDDFFASPPWPCLDDGASGEWLPPSLAEALGDSVLVAPSLGAALEAVVVSSPWAYAHCMALVQWLRVYIPPTNAPLDQVRGWLEAFYHACEAELWGVAWAIAQATTKAGIPLYRQLGQWGHRHEQVELCETLLPHAMEPLQRELRQLAGDGRRLLGDYNTARHHYAVLLQEGQGAGNGYPSLQAGLGLARIAMEQLAYSTAARSLAQLLPEAEALGDVVVTIEVLQQLALAYGYTGRSRQSLTLLQRALALAKAHGLSDAEVTTLQALGKVYQWRGQSQRALPYLNRLLAVAQAQQNLALEADTYEGLARASFGSGQFAEAITYGEYSLALYRSIHHADREFLTLNDLGAFYAYGLGQITPALDYFRQAEALARQVGCFSNVAVATANQAYCHTVLGQRPLAYRASQTALAIANQIELTEEHRLIVYSGLARVYWVDRHYGKALALVWQALCLAPPWRSINGQLLLAKTWETLRQLPQQWWHDHFRRPQSSND